MSRLDEQHMQAWQERDFSRAMDSIKERAQRKEALCLYEGEPIGVDGALEANGRVYHFCSEKCRRMFEVDPEITLHAGTSGDYIQGTVCDECSIPLEAAQ